MVYSKPTCRGCYALGTACGRCERCAEEHDRLNSVKQNATAMMAQNPREARDRAVILSAVAREMEEPDFENVLRLLEDRADFRHGRRFLQDALARVAYAALMTERAQHAGEMAMLNASLELKLEGMMLEPPIAIVTEPLSEAEKIKQGHELRRDLMLYGTAFTYRGRRIDPREVRVQIVKTDPA